MKLSHFHVSIVKSIIRIGAGIFLISVFTISIIFAIIGALIIISELLGIIEELVAVENKSEKDEIVEKEEKKETSYNFYSVEELQNIIEEYGKRHLKIEGKVIEE